MTRQDLTLLVPRSWWPQRRRRGRGRYGLVVGIVLSALALSGCFGPGYYSVGHPLTSRQLPPGLWRSLGGDGCSWTRVQPGSPSSAGTNTHTRGPQYVHIAPSDKGFVTSNCFPFWQEPGVYARPVTTPGSPFGDGDFLVGYEVMPGTYVASVPAGQTCSWAVVKGFHGNNAAGRNQDFVRGDSTRTSAPAAVIEPGDYGFTSQGCGQWHLSSPLPAAPGGAAASGLEIDDVVEDFPDPFVLRIDDPAVCGGRPRPASTRTRPNRGSSGSSTSRWRAPTDLVSWAWGGPDVTNVGVEAADGKPDHDAMPTLAPWVAVRRQLGAVGDRTSVEPSHQRFVMYYTAKARDWSMPWGGKQCVGIATSASPGGPFVDDANAPVLCNTAAGGTIDPSPFLASTGALYLHYADDVGIRASD